MTKKDFLALTQYTHKKPDSFYDFFLRRRDPHEFYIGSLSYTHPAQWGDLVNYSGLFHKSPSVDNVLLPESDIKPLKCNPAISIYLSVSKKMFYMAVSIDKINLSFELFSALPLEGMFLWSPLQCVWAEITEDTSPMITRNLKL